MTPSATPSASILAGACAPAPRGREALPGRTVPRQWAPWLLCIVMAGGLVPLARGTEPLVRQSAPQQPAPQQSAPVKPRSEPSMATLPVAGALAIGQPMPTPFPWERAQWHRHQDRLDAAWSRRRVTLIHLWAPWHRGSRESRAVVEAFADPGVAVVSLAVWPRPDAAPLATLLEDPTAADVPVGEDTHFALAGLLASAGRSLLPTALVVAPGGELVWVGDPRAATFGAVVSAARMGRLPPAPAAPDPATTRALTAAALPAIRRLGVADSSADWAGLLRVADGLLARHDMFANFAWYRHKALVHLGHGELARAYGRALLVAELRDAELQLNSLAWALVNPRAGLDASRRDTELALAAARRAAELTGRRHAAILDTLARAWFEAGDVGQAVAVQTEALALMQPDAPLRAALAPALAEYRAAQR